MSANSSSDHVEMMRPGLTPESRENQLIALAVDLAEQQLKNGTASSQVVCHYLKLASTKMTLEKEKLIEENKLLRAKTEALQSAKRQEELFIEAIQAMKSYRSSDHSGDYDDD